MDELHLYSDKVVPDGGLLRFAPVLGARSLRTPSSILKMKEPFGGAGFGGVTRRSETRPIMREDLGDGQRHESDQGLVRMWRAGPSISIGQTTNQCALMKKT